MRVLDVSHARTVHSAVRLVHAADEEAVAVVLQAREGGRGDGLEILIFLEIPFMRIRDVSLDFLLEFNDDDSMSDMNLDGIK